MIDSMPIGTSDRIPRARKGYCRTTPQGTRSERIFSDTFPAKDPNALRSQMRAIFENSFPAGKTGGTEAGEEACHD